MLVWGQEVRSFIVPLRYVNDGAIYNPILDTWRPITTTGSPSPGRNGYSVVWTGQEIFIWGGVDDSNNPDNVICFNDGYKYNLSTDTWSPLPPVNLTPRHGHGAWWLGQEMLIWGGSNGTIIFRDGAIYH